MRPPSSRPAVSSREDYSGSNLKQQLNSETEGVTPKLWSSLELTISAGFPCWDCLFQGDTVVNFWPFSPTSSVLFWSREREGPRRDQGAGSCPIPRTLFSLSLKGGKRGFFFWWHHESSPFWSGQMLLYSRWLPGPPSFAPRTQEILGGSSYRTLLPPLCFSWVTHVWSPGSIMASGPSNPWEWTGPSLAASVLHTSWLLLQEAFQGWREGAAPPAGSGSLSSPQRYVPSGLGVLWTLLRLTGSGSE